MCGGGLAVASTYLVSWGVLSLNPQLLTGTGGSYTLARFSEYLGGWFGLAAAVMVTGGALLVAAGALSLIFPRSRPICGIAFGLGSLMLLLAAVKSVGLPSNAFALGPAIWLCLIGAVAGAFSAVVVLAPSVGRSHRPLSQLPVGVGTAGG